MRRVWWILFGFSQVVFLALMALFFLGFMPFIEGSSFLGWYSATAIEYPSTENGMAHWYSIHGEYRGIFFKDGIFAAGDLVEDREVGQQSTWMPKTGFRMMGGVACFPLNPPRPRAWNVFGVDVGEVRYGNPVPPNSWRSNRIRANVGLVFAMECVALAMGLVMRIKRRQVRIET